VLLGPRLDGKRRLAAWRVDPPRLGQGGQVLQRQVVQVDGEPAGVPLGIRLRISRVRRYVETRCIDNLAALVAQNPEDSVEKPRDIVTFL
jgi:hypothetical protein